MISGPTELGMRLEVIEAGPYLPLEPNPRTFSDVLPGDTIRVRSLIADVGGPVADQELSALWVLCGIDDCRDGLGRAPDLDPCPADRFVPEQPCLLGSSGGTVEAKLGDFDDQSFQSGAAAFVSIASIGMLASLGAPTVEQCAQRVRDRQQLDGCLLMLRPVTLGPNSAVLGTLQSLGVELEQSIEDNLDLLLQTPRNRNPEVEAFAVRGSSELEEDRVEFPAGATVSVRIGDPIDIVYLPGEEDLDDWSYELDGVQTLVGEELVGQWFIDSNPDSFEQTSVQASWTPQGPPRTTYVYYIARDVNGGEAWGWLLFDILAS